MLPNRLDSAEVVSKRMSVVKSEADDVHISASAHSRHLADERCDHEFGIEFENILTE
jgi:hypothetical protein